MVFNVAIILVFAIVVFVAFLLSLVAILLYVKRRASQQRQAGKNGRKETTGDELTESEAADITSTWNTLNPP